MTSIVPSDWASTTLDSLANVVMGSSPLSSSYNEEQDGLPLIQGNADIKDRKSVPRVYTSTPTQVCVDGDILLTVRAPVGYVAKATLKACLGRGVCAITPTNIDSDYLYQALLGQEPKWGALEQGSTFKAINRDDVTKLLVLRPPLQEQKKIAKILTTVDKKLDNIEKKIAVTQQLKKGLMQKLFSQGAGIPVEDAGGKITWRPHTEFEKSELGLIPKGWEFSSVEDLLIDKKGLAYGVLQPVDAGEDGVPMIRTVDIMDGGFSGTRILKIPKEMHEEYTRTQLKGGEVLLSVMGTIGRTMVVPETCSGWNVNRALAVIRLNGKVDSTFFNAYLRSPKMQEKLTKQSIGSAQLRINLADFKKYVVPVPPPKEQERIAVIASSIEEKIKHINKEKLKAIEMKKGLMQKLLTGQWRVQIDEDEQAS